MPPMNLTPQQQNSLNYVNSQPAIPSGGGDNENAITRLLPTAGGIVGGLLGSILPGGPLTGIAGASIGGGLGKAAENFFSGGDDATKGVLESAISNGVGQGVGGIAAKAGGALLSGATGALGKAVEGRAAQAAAEQTASSATKAAADATAQAEARALAYKNNYGSISDRLQRDLKLGSNAKFVDKVGFDSTDPAQMKLVSDAGLDLNGVYDKALQKAAPVDMSGFGTNVYADLKKNGITDLGTTPLGKAIAEAQIPLDQPNLKLPAVQVRKLQQAVGNQIGNTKTLINNAELQGVSNTEAEAQLKSLQDVYKSLGAKIKTPEVNTAIAATKLSSAERVSLVEKYGEKLGNTVADTVDNAQTADNLLGPMQSYTQMSHAAGMAKNDIENAIATPRAVARTKADLTPAPAPAPAAPANSGILDALSIGAIPFTGGLSAIGLAPHAISAAKNPAVQEAVYNKLSSITGNAAAKKIVPTLTRAGAIGAANLPNMAAPPASAIPGTMGGANMEGQMQQQQNPLNQAYQVALAGGGLTPGSASLLQTLAPTIQKQELAQPIIAGAQGAFQNAGGAQGAFGGALSTLSGLVPGSAANTYQGQQASAAATLASILGISPEAALQLLPGLMQNQASAGVRMGALNGLTASVGASPLGSAIPMAQ